MNFVISVISPSFSTHLL